MADERSGAETAQILGAIGELSGTVAQMNASISQRFADMREDIRRMEAAYNDRLDRTEGTLGKRIDDMSESLGKRVDGLSARVTDLEREDKLIVRQVAAIGATGGGVGGALTVAAVELLKRIGG